MKSDWLIRALLRLYPGDFRRRYGADMLEFHRERMQSAGSTEWLHVFTDHIRSALVERFRRAHREQPEVTNGVSMRTLLQDLRFALRALRRRRVFTLVVVSTIALGVGANAAIFSVVHGILLRPLPYPDAERVVSFGHEAPYWLLSQPEYFDYTNNLRSFEGLAAYIRSEANLASEEEPERIATAGVTLNFFSVLGVQPMLGRAFSGDEDLVMPSNVVIVSHGLWQRRLGGDPGIIGKTISLNGRARTVVGVMPPHFDYPTEQTDLWQPLPRMRADSLGDRANHYLFAVGRLQRGISLERASAEVVPFARRMMQDNISRYDPNQPLVPVISQVRENLIGSTRPYLWALLGAVGFVLLIVCVNVANLLLARGEGRRKEMALRNALGASRWRLGTQLLVECIVLALTGGTLGVLLAALANRALLTVAPATIPRLDQIGIDWFVLGYALLISLVTGLLFGVMPALRASRESPGVMLKQGGRNEHEVGSRHVRRALVVAEVALAVVMLTGAGMLVRSLLHLQRTDIGFDSRSALTAKVSLAGYDDGRATVFFSQLLERVRALPGVQSAGAARWLPVIEEGGLWGLVAEGQSYDNVPQAPTAEPQQVTPGYFAAMGLPLLRGRDFTEQDRATGPYVAIVSKSLAQHLWPNTDPLGKRIRLGGGEVFMTVVGVVNDIRSSGFAGTPEPTMYFPFAQTAVSAYFMPRSMSLVIRTSGEPMAVANQVRTLVRSLDATVPVSNVRTLEQVIGTSVANRRFSTALITAFAALALLLAGIGIFGVISYGVSERTFEIGVRMALGAERGKALAMVVGDSLRMALLGIALGLAGAALVARAIRSMLVDVPIFDVPTMLLVTTLLVLVVIVATILPARRAMAVDPTQALRG